ncbi:MAG: hypothetical protein IH586_21150, partial [Anaerolineaceae bacterium]|nr:hypothetical protein [Anaerolineaceae bacterium]
MDFFGGPNIEKMTRENDREGLYQLLEHHNHLVQLQAAQALAVMGDGAGWRHLTEAAAQERDGSLQETAASILGELGSRSAGDAHRVVPVLGDALKRARGETADAIRDALISIGGDEAEEALREAGYTATPEESAGEVNDYEAHFIRPVLPNTAEFEFLTAEQHLNNAIELREAELSERGLVECSLAQWLKPDWAYAWYLRGVLFEDLERSYEAWLAYHRAVSLDPALHEALEALGELNEEETFELPQEDWLIPALADRDWRARRNAAAGIGALGHTQPQKAEEYNLLLFNLLADGEREVRYAAVNSLGLLGSRSAILPLIEMKESSWLMRFAIIEALSRLGSVDGLV